MPKNENQKDTTSTEAKASAAADQAHNELHGEELDLDALDLSVETAEERISPSETNVFDK